MDIHASLIEMITESDRAGANRLVEGWMVEHGHERLVVDVLGPVLKLVGASHSMYVLASWVLTWPRSCATCTRNWSTWTQA